MSKKHARATISVRGHATAFARPDEAAAPLVLAAVHPTRAGRARRRRGALPDPVGPARRARHRRRRPVHVLRHGRRPHGVSRGRGRLHGQAGRDPGRRAAARTCRSSARSCATAVDRAGAQVEPPRYTVAGDNPAQLEAYRLAAGDARLRADAYAEGLGIKAGDVLAVAEGRRRAPAALRGQGVSPASRPTSASSWGRWRSRPPSRSTFAVAG